MRSRVASIGAWKNGEVSTTITSYDSRATSSSRTELGLGHELCVLGAKRRRQDVEPARVLRDVARELLGIELARGHDEVVDRLVRLEAEHDRRVAELQVEIEQQRAPALVLRERGREG